MSVRTSFFTVLILALSFGIAGADWLALDAAFAGRSFDTHATAQTPEKLAFDLEVHGLDASVVASPLGSFARVRLDDTGYTQTVGAPQLPVIRRLIRVPEDATVRVRAAGTPERFSLSDLTGLDEIVPVQPSVEKIPGALEATPFAYDRRAYAQNKFVFPKPAEITEIGHFRGYRVAWLELRPVNYNPASGGLTIIRDLHVEISFAGGNLDKTAEMIRRYADPRTNAILKEMTLDDAFGGVKYDPASSPSSYLVIGRADFFNLPAFQDYVSWKRRKGYDVVFIAAQDAGGTPQAIRNTIINAYQTWERPPAYVLLLGDTDAMPNFTGQYQDRPATDLYYQFMDDADFFPDLGIGRFSARSPDQIVNIVNKTLANEMMNFATTDWIKNAAFMASDDNHDITEGTHNWVIDRYLNAEDYNSTLLYAAKGATTQQALTAVNGGLSLLTYSGHGDTDYWADGPVVDQNDVRNLTNQVYPMVFSFACLTGRYQEQECFSETWLRVPTGAVAMMASSVTSLWTEDDILEKAIYWGFFQGDDNARLMTWTAGMIDFAKLGLYQYFGGNPMSHRYLEMYNLFGDPEQMILTEAPVPAEASFEGVLEEDGGTLQFSVANGPFAMVGISAGTKYLGTGYADANGDGEVTVDSPLSADQNVTATVTGHNLIPAVITLHVGEPVDDDADDWHGDDSGDDTAFADDDASDDDAGAKDASDDDAGDDGSCGC